MSKTNKNREVALDRLIAGTADRLWQNPLLLKLMGKNVKEVLVLQQQWNQVLLDLWALLQLPNQQMQQRMMHLLQMLTTEWRFEQEDTRERLEKIELELAEIKALLKQKP